MARTLALSLLLAAAAATAARADAAAVPASPTTVTRTHHHHRRRHVEVVLYGEALCPDTAAWVARILKPAVEAGLIGPAPPRRRVVVGGEDSEGEEEEEEEDDAATTTPPASRRHRRARPLASLRYVGWGNAARSPVSGAVTFQHGPREGELDAALNCAGAGGTVDAPPPHTSRRAALDLLLCYFSAVAANGTAGRDPATIAACAAGAGVRDWGAILACAAGPAGAALARSAEAETAGLDPPKTFVPWVTVDGEAMAGECGALVRWVCARAGGGGGGIEGGDHPACAAARGQTPPPCPGAGVAVVGLG